MKVFGGAASSNLWAAAASGNAAKSCKSHRVCGTHHRDAALRTRMRSRIVDRARPGSPPSPHPPHRPSAARAHSQPPGPHLHHHHRAIAHSSAPAACRRQRRPSAPRGCRRVRTRSRRGEASLVIRHGRSCRRRRGSSDTHCTAHPPHPWPQPTAARAHSRARCPCKKLRRKRAPRRPQDRPRSSPLRQYRPRAAPPERPRPPTVVTSQLPSDSACPAPDAGSATTSRSTSLVRSASAHVSLAPVAAGQRRAPPPPRHRYQRTPRARQWRLRLRTKLPLSQLWSTRIVAP